MRKVLTTLIAIALLATIGLIAPTSASALTGATGWTLRVGAGLGSNRDPLGFSMAYMSVRVGSDVHVTGVDLATTKVTFRTPSGTYAGEGNLRSGFEVDGSSVAGDFVDIYFPDAGRTGDYYLILDLSVPAHWEARPYNPSGALWHAAATVHREYKFNYQGYDSAHPPFVVSPIKFTSTQKRTVKRTVKAKASVSVKAKATVRYKGEKATAIVKAKGTATRSGSATKTASKAATGWSQAEANSLAGASATKAATASAKTAASKAAKTSATKAAKAAAKKSATKKAKAKALKLAKVRATKAARA